VVGAKYQQRSQCRAPKKLKKNGIDLEPMSDTIKTTQPQFTRTDCKDFYANNLQLEPSAWDLKLVFGRLNQSEGDIVEQHATVTIPWKLARLAIYYLTLQVHAHEFSCGALTLPVALWPPRPVLGEAFKDDPRARKAWELACLTHDALIADFTRALITDFTQSPNSRPEAGPFSVQ
jgi:hypothetical protein